MAVRYIVVKMDSLARVFLFEAAIERRPVLFGNEEPRPTNPSEIKSFLEPGECSDETTRRHFEVILSVFIFVGSYRETIGDHDELLALHLGGEVGEVEGFRRRDWGRHGRFIYETRSWIDERAPSVTFEAGDYADSETSTQWIYLNHDQEKNASTIGPY